MEPVQEGADTRSVLQSAAGLAATALDVGEQAIRAKQTVEHAIEDGVRAARHAARRGRFVAEDLKDRATLEVRQNPFTSLGWALAAGIVLGGIVACAVGRIGRRR